MNKFFSAVFIAIVLLSCSNDKERPKNVLEKQKLAEVLIDIHLIEARTSQAKLPRDSSISYYTYLQDSIYKIHEIDSAQFHESMIYYTERIREMDMIYEVVLDSLNLKSAIEAQPIKN